MKSAWAELGPAMADPVAGMQACFRATLQALARPGRVFELPDVALRGLQVPTALDGTPPMAPATAALLLTLLDADTTVTLHGSLGSTPTSEWLRFHTGVREALPGEPSAFVVARASEWSLARWQTVELGSDEAPQRGATVVLDVAGLAGAEEAWEDGDLTPGPHNRLELRGPGIESVHGARTAGVPWGFWQQRVVLEGAYPRGVDILLTCGRRVMGLPRSTRLTVLSCGEH